MRKLIVAAVVLVLLAVVADRVAKDVVEGRLADRIASAEGVDHVDVDIEGFPFLTQVLANRFDEVRVSFPRLDTHTVAGSVEVENLRVSLRDVVTSDQYRRATAGSVTGSGSIPYSAFNQFGFVRVSYGGEASDGHAYVKVSAPILSDRRIRLRPTVVDDGRLELETLNGRALAPALRLQGLVGRALAVAGLPDDIHVDSVEATPDGLQVDVTGTEVRLTG